MPKVVGNYVLGKTLGKGKYSVVKFGVHDITKESFAIKIMSLSDIKKDQMESQLRREIAIMKMVNHENVVKLKEVLQTDRNIYIIMELVTGGELFERIVSETRLPEDNARYFFKQLIRAIEYCHMQGIAHRDLKPENLLLDQKDRLKVSDFGLSTIIHQNSNIFHKKNKNKLLMTTCGTPNYVAPEVIKENGYDGFKSDIWSCGIILFVMVTGKLPFDSKDVELLFSRVQSGKVQYPNYLSPLVIDLISRILTVDPSKRISIEDIKKHPWMCVRRSGKTPSSPYEIISLTQFDEMNALTKTGKERSEIDDIGSLNYLKYLEVERNQISLNAFEIANHLIMNHLSRMITFNNDIENTDILKKGNQKISSQEISIQLYPHKFTKFISKCCYDETTHVLMDTLQSKRANPKLKKEKSEISCFTSVKSEGSQTPCLMTFKVIITKTIAKDIVFVEFQRGKGNTLDFFVFYNHIIQSLRHIMLTDCITTADLSSFSPTSHPFSSSRSLYTYQRVSDLSTIEKRNSSTSESQSLDPLSSNLSHSEHQPIKFESKIAIRNEDHSKNNLKHQNFVIENGKRFTLQKHHLHNSSAIITTMTEDQSFSKKHQDSSNFAPVKHRTIQKKACTPHSIQVSEELSSSAKNLLHAICSFLFFPTSPCASGFE